MKFGVEVPTCTAGMMYPVPFATAQDVVRVAIEAEQLGYYDVGGNDHLSTQQYVREAWSRPPDYFEPLITLATIAAKTSVVRLTTGILVLPMRDPVLLAKQVATLDQLSGGRVLLGVAVGGYRDEFERVVPDLRDASRADLISEGIEALRVLFTQPRATYQGHYRRFEDVESFPKPLQAPLPIYSGGNVEGAIRRAAELCEGWLPAKIGPDRIRTGRMTLERHARQAGRDPSKIATALQSIVCLGDTTEQARERFMRSAFDLFRQSLQQTDDQGGRSRRLRGGKSDRRAGRGLREGGRLRAGRGRPFLRHAVRGQHGRRNVGADTRLRPRRHPRFPRAHTCRVMVQGCRGWQAHGAYASDRYGLCPLASSERQGTVARPRPLHRPGGAATCPRVGLHATASDRIGRWAAGRVSLGRISSVWGRRWVASRDHHKVGATQLSGAHLSASQDTSGQMSRAAPR